MIDHDEFRQVMGEAAPRTADDPVRRDVEQRVLHEEVWAEKEWQALQQENESLRRELAEVDLPPHLTQSLLAVSRDSMPQNRSSDRKHKFAVTAVAVLLVAAGIALNHQLTLNSRLRTVSLLAINNHLNHLDDHGVHESATSRDELERALTDELAFAVTVPELGSELQLVGGRTCKLGTREVAFTLWDGSDGEYSLFQFRPDEFGLPEQMSRSLIRSHQPAAEGHECGAWIWCEGSQGYVLVSDPGCALETLSFKD